MDKKKIVIGTRRWLGEDWWHVDADPAPLSGGHRVETVCDARSIPLPSGCAELVYSQECLEHFPWKDGPAVLAEWCRLVGPGGVIHIEVPDLLAACQQVLQTDTLEMDRRIQQIIFGGQSNSFDFHYMGWTPRMLEAELENLGFRVFEIQRGWEAGWLTVKGKRL